MNISANLFETTGNYYKKISGLYINTKSCGQDLMKSKNLQNHQQIFKQINQKKNMKHKRKLNSIYTRDSKISIKITKIDTATVLCNGKN